MRGVSLNHIDNWIGRLPAEYAKSEASAKQGFQLAEWFIKKIKPLIIIRGNHDAWPGQDDPLKDGKKAQFYLDRLIQKLEQ